MSHEIKRAALVVAGLLLISAVTAAEKTSASKSSQGSPSAVEPKAVESLQRMSAYLGSLKEFTFEVDNMLDHVFDNGQKIQLSDHLEISVRRPDGMAASASGDTRDERWWYRGTSATLYNRRLNERTSMKVPATIEQMLDHLANKYGLVMPLAELLFENTYDAVIENVLSGAYVGLHQVQGVKCHHLAFRQAAVDWQIWIEDGPKPVPRKVVITYREVPGQPQYVAILGHWNANPRLPDSTFEAKCPPDSKEVPIEEALQHRAEFEGVGAGQADR